jgi:hypothetical protein
VSDAIEALKIMLIDLSSSLDGAKYKKTITHIAKHLQRTNQRN